MCPDNVVAAKHHHTTVNPSTVEDRLYIIDFDSSRQFTLGPGVQRAITLPETQIEPPDGLKDFDPYSWDVYCTGRTLERMVIVRHFSYSTSCIVLLLPLRSNDIGERRQSHIGSLKSTSSGLLGTKRAALACVIVARRHVRR